MKDAQYFPLDENAVVTAIVKFLSDSGFVITQQLHIAEYGIDVIAQHPQTKIRVFVDAKGGTSSREASQRYGKPYTQIQVFDRVAKGIFTCLQLRTAHPDKNTIRVILAIPENPNYFKDYIDSVTPTLDAAGIEVWFAKGTHMQISDDKVDSQCVPKVPENPNAGVGDCRRQYRYYRLCFKADVIEPLGMDDKFCIVTDNDGTYVMTKRQFYETFPQVVESKIYRLKRLYHYPKPPRRALKYKVG